MQTQSWCSLVIAASVQSSVFAGAASLPIKEVTVFKDGHALVLRYGKAETNEAGNVVFADLPRPVLGTFWAYEDDDQAELRFVRAATLAEVVERPAGNVAELIEANVGATIRFAWNASGEMREGIVRAVIAPPSVIQSTQSIFNNRNSSPFSSPTRSVQVVEQPKTVLIAAAAGETLVVPLASLRDVTFVDVDPTATPLSREQEVDRLTLDLDWDGDPNKTTDVGLMYVQRGLRWIPSYRVTILSSDTLRLELQATLINELADLEGVTAHLVIGAPRFQFEHTPDPIGLNDVLAPLGPFFQTGQTGRALSVALLGQGGRMGEFAGGGSARSSTMADVALDFAKTERAEDLFIFTVDSISLARDERLTIPLVSIQVPYQSLYRLDLTGALPRIDKQRYNDNQRRELAQLMARSRPRHTLRLRNRSQYPITTAPALIVDAEGIPLAQGMLTYTASGGSVDLEVADAIDIAVATEHEELGRELNVQQLGSAWLHRFDLRNKVMITNFKLEPIQIEIQTFAFGTVESTSPLGETTPVNIYFESSFGSGGQMPWPTWWQWPWWWTKMNAVTRIEWTIEIDPGQTKELNWDWRYLGQY